MLGTYIAIGAAIVIIIALLTVRAALMNSTWSLSDALSEEADITPLDSTGRPLLDSTGKPYLGLDGKALTVSELRASSSRFIALIGLIGILMLYLGFGLVVLARVGNASDLLHPVLDDKDINSIENFLLYGAVMFAPYIANKLSSVFDWLKPGK